MKVAVIGSRDLIINNLGVYLPTETTEIVSGGARGIDSCAKIYAQKHNLPFKVFLPNYEQFGRRAPLVRNLQIIDYADEVIDFWDGKSKGTKYVIDNCERQNKKVTVYMLDK